MLNPTFTLNYYAPHLPRRAFLACLSAQEAGFTQMQHLWVSYKNPHIMRIKIHG